jgi:hypothetical protein
MPVPSMSVIIVSWNTADLLEKCLRSLERHEPPPGEILVVDNASSDGSADGVRRQFPRVTLLPQSVNLGYVRANNLALPATQGRYLLLLNPDTEVLPGALESLATFLEGHPRAGIAGPPLWNPDGSHQPSVQLAPTLRTEFLRHTMLHRVVPNRERREGVRRDTRPVEAITGAALCIRRECWEGIGPLDETIFMFYEDTDWCRRARDAGWEVWYVNGPGVLHHKGAASTGAARTRTLLDSLRGSVQYFRKHQGEEAVVGLRAIALLGAILRSVRSLVLLILGRERPDQRARLAAYFRIARWALKGGDLAA